MFDICRGKNNARKQDLENRVKLMRVFSPSNSACIMGLNMLKQMPNLGR